VPLRSDLAFTVTESFASVVHAFTPNFLEFICRIIPPLRYYSYIFFVCGQKRIQIPMNCVKYKTFSTLMGKKGLKKLPHKIFGAFSAMIRRKAMLRLEAKTTYRPEGKPMYELEGKTMHRLKQ
jgi:hypothetical protein